MIPFFRKTRKKMADDNKPMKYMRYAIGEIALVVIGILIAIQINNWNEGRKGKEKLNILFEQVQKELLVNIKKTDEATEFYRGKDSLIYNVLNNKVNYDDYKSNLLLSHLIYEEFKVDLLDDAFKNLIDYNVQLSKDTDSLVFKLKGLYGKEKKEVDEYDKQILDVILFNLREIENEKKWFSNSIFHNEVQDEQIAYYLTDTIYRNRVANFYMIGIGNHYSKTRIFRNRALNIYEDVCDYLDLEKDTSIVKDLNDYKHYIGVYELNSLYNTYIVLENNTLMANVIAKNDTIILESYIIYPISKNYCILGNGIFGQLKYDENNEVSEMLVSKGSGREEFKKIQNPSKNKKTPYK